jgi:hypothetical protein
MVLSFFGWVVSVVSPFFVFALYQGTTSVVPPLAQNNRALQAAEKLSMSP